jgi:hypothetical protein
VHGTVVVLYTHVGELTLDAEAIFFHETLEGAFSRAGLKVQGYLAHKKTPPP